VVVREEGCRAVLEEDLFVRIKEARGLSHGGRQVGIDVSVPEVVDVGGLWGRSGQRVLAAHDKA
jgi:hypothetical protein